MKIHFLSFASSRFYRTLDRIEYEAKMFGHFDSVSCLRSIELSKMYRLKHIFLLNRFTRGYGYWIWKSYITKKRLDEMNEGDILVYADAGCKINKEGEHRFNEYIELLQQSEYSNLAFQSVYKEKSYTKVDVFRHFGIADNASFEDTGQLIGTIYLIQKTEESLALVNEWYSTCHNHINLIDDSSSKFQSSKEFIDHRHDQSIFSLIRKIRGGLFLPDETYFMDWDAKLKFPFHAARLRF